MVYQMTNECDRPLGCESFAETGFRRRRAASAPPAALDQPGEQIIPVATQKIKGHKRRLRSAALGQERAGVAPPVVAEHDRLSVDERRIHVETTNRGSGGNP